MEMIEGLIVTDLDLLETTEVVETAGNAFYGILLCLAIVFVGFIALWVMLSLLGLFNRGNMIKRNRKKITKTTKPEEITEIKTIAGAIIPAESNEEEEDDEELIAVITAAVAAILEKPVSGFRVVSFKKRPGWKSL